MAYEALSRVTTLQGLNILHLDTDCIFASPAIKKSLEIMPKFLEYNAEENSESCCLKIVLHNTEGLLPHMKDIENACVFHTSQVVCLTETWLNKKDYVPPTLLPDSEIHAVHREDAYTSDDPIFRQFKSVMRLYSRPLQ